MKKIAIFTTNRAEFGIFSALIREIEKQKSLEYCLFVGGAHLDSKYGKTINEIENVGFKITEIFDFLLNEDTSIALAKSVGIATYEIANIFNNYEFDFVCILGDRFELLSVVICSILFKKPIIHLHGGERSEGAVDEQIRHMITKAAHIHFVACEEYAYNIRRMGEPEWRIFNTGALGIDNIKKKDQYSKKDLFHKLGLSLKKETIILTYHPVTLEYKISPIHQIENIFNALKKFNFQILITSPNIEVDRELIYTSIQNEVKKNKDYHFIESLGVDKYHNLIPNSKFVIGNSSSGIIEVPFLKIPTINIGDRQKGRIQHKSIINTDYSVESIVKGIEKAISKQFIDSIKSMEYKFGNGTAAGKMVEIIKKVKIDEKLIRKELDFPKDYR